MDKDGDLETTGIIIIVVGAALVLACLAGNADNSFKNTIGDGGSTAL